jgi:ADP-ribose pyrophosphatase YjhB (NUDIX family)
VPPNVTRPCAFVFVRADDRVLVSEMGNGADLFFYRPPGGGIEFGETSEAAARREMNEELGIDVRRLALLGVQEDLFTLRGQPYHEIDFIYETWLTAAALVALDGAAIVEDDDDVETARVVSLADLRAGLYTPLYPEGVLDLLR